MRAVERDLSTMSYLLIGMVFVGSEIFGVERTLLVAAGFGLLAIIASLATLSWRQLRACPAAHRKQKSLPPA